MADDRRIGWAKQGESRSKRPPIKAETTVKNTENVPAIVVKPLKCPHCGAKNRIGDKKKNLKVISTKPPVRYYKCRVCAENFQTIETE